MSDSDAKAGALTTARSRAPWWFALAGRMLRPWIRIKRDPSEPASLLMTGRPVCYVLERHGFSDALILERACKDSGLPSPTDSLSLAGMRRRFSMFSLARREGWVLGRTRKRASDAALMQMLKSFDSAPDQDVQLVPVSIYVGRAPARESGWFRVLFSENWVVVGRFRRLLAILLNGRSTVVHFAEPVSLRQAVEESPELEPSRLARKLSRVFRVHFRRIRAAVVGPDLSHRRTVVGSVLDAAPVREAIAASAIKNKLSAAQAQRRARKMVMEIAADYSHPVVRSASFILTWFWNKLYDGVGMRHFEQARAAAPGHEIVYVPSHRSHADYLLLSYKLHVSGVVPPHIAAGINLNLPVIGSILRRGGAFFMRRSFKGSAVVLDHLQGIPGAADRPGRADRILHRGRALAHRPTAGSQGWHAVDDLAGFPARAASPGAFPAGLHRLRKADGRQCLCRGAVRPAQGEGVPAEPFARRRQGAAPALRQRDAELRRAGGAQCPAGCHCGRLAKCQRGRRCQAGLVLRCGRCAGPSRSR